MGFGRDLRAGAKETWVFNSAKGFLGLRFDLGIEDIKIFKS